MPPEMHENKKHKELCMKSMSKAVFLTLALVVFASVAFCQGYPYQTDATTGSQNPYMEGTLAGKNDATGSIAYGCGGLACGVLGIVAAAISDPEPEPQKINYLLQSKGAEYVSAYTTSYTKEARKKNITYAAIGWGVSVVAYSIYYIAAVAAAVDDLDDDPYDKKVPVKPGITIPLGNPVPNFSPNN